MDQIIYIFIVFNILFLIEKKEINILIAYIGIVLSLAIKINNEKLINLIDGEYFTYILILIQISSLTILFGFILMLYPSKERYMIKNNKYNKIWKVGVLLIIMIFLLYYYKESYIYNINLIDFDSLYIKNDSIFLRKLGLYLYAQENNIIKLMLLLIILLLAMLSLFFLLSSSFF